jgi:hypothetical protein
MFVLYTDTAALQRTHLASIAAGIAILAWPQDAVAAHELGREGTPRLLLVAADADPPEQRDRLTEWVRLPADDRDIEARLLTLRARRQDVMTD